jgi:hypothetical protein
MLTDDTGEEDEDVGEEKKKFDRRQIEEQSVFARWRKNRQRRRIRIRISDVAGGHCESQESASTKN